MPSPTMDAATRDRWALHYALAIETRDLNAVGSALAAASTDRLLSDILSEIDRQNAEDAAPRGRSVPETTGGTVTLGHVARLLTAQGISDPYLARIAESSTLLPGRLTPDTVGRALAAETGAPPSHRLRSLFRNEAVKALMQHEARHVQADAHQFLAAARSTDRPDT